MAVGNLLFFFDRNFSNNQVKFIYSEKATKFFKISKLLLSYVVPVKSKMEILQNFVAFSECMNFKDSCFFFDRNSVAINFCQQEN